MKTVELMPEKTITGFRAKHTMHEDSFEDVVKALDTVVDFYNAFAAKRNEDFKAKNGLSKVEYPRLNLLIKKLNDSESLKTVICDLSVVYPEGTESREKDTHKLL